eukprot:jgi/Chlat1/1711/Chrsp127S00096
MAALAAFQRVATRQDNWRVMLRSIGSSAFPGDLAPSSAGHKETAPTQRAAGKLGNKAAVSRTAVAMATTSSASIDDDGKRKPPLRKYGQQRFLNVELIFPHADKDPDEWKRVIYEFVTKSALQRAVKDSGGIAVAEYSTVLESKNGIKCLAFEHLQLKDGGRYVLVRPDETPLHATVKTHEGFIENMAHWQEDEVAEHGIAWLDGLGYQNPQRLCQRVFTSKDGKIDGVVIADGAAAIIEAKNVVTSEDAKELHGKLVKLRIMLKEGAPSVRALQGRRLLLVLCGRSVTKKETDRLQLLERCDLDRIELWLPNGVGYGTGDGCTKAPFKHPPASSCE